MNNKPICQLSEMDMIRDEWEDVYAECDPKSPILTFECTKLWYECFAKQDNIRIYRIIDNNGYKVKTIGFMPMSLEKKNGMKILSNQTNDHCFDGEALIRKGSEHIFKANILKQLFNDKEWDVLHHRFSYSFSSLYPVFPEQIIKEFGFPRIINTGPTYTIYLGKPFSDYCAKDLSHNLRKQLTRCRNKLLKASYKFKHYQGSEAVESWQEFLRIEDSGWKGKGGTSILKTETKFQRYYEGLIKILSKHNKLHLYFLEVEKRNIACVFGYTAGDLFQYLKIGYDEQYQSLSPSNLLFMFLLEDLSSNFGVKRIHLFPYDTGYKERFANEDSIFSDITLYNKTVCGQVAYLSDSLKRKIADKPKLAGNIKKILSIINK